MVSTGLDKVVSMENFVGSEVSLQDVVSEDEFQTRLPLGLDESYGAFYYTPELVYDDNSVIKSSVDEDSEFSGEEWSGPSQEVVGEAFYQVDQLQSQVPAGDTHAYLVPQHQDFRTMDLPYIDERVSFTIEAGSVENYEAILGGVRVDLYDVSKRELVDLAKEAIGVEGLVDMIGRDDVISAIGVQPFIKFWGYRHLFRTLGNMERN